MHSFFKEEVNIYRQMFCRESRKSVSGMEILNDFVSRIHESAKNTTDIHEIQRSIRLFSIFCDILEAFNANIETLVSSIDEQTFNDVMTDSPNIVCLRIKDWIADLSSYQIGEQFKGAISYILDGNSKLCFIKDQTKNKMIDFKSELESTFTGIPNYGEVFALEINQKFFRAIRTDTEATNTSIRVRLIDIGETISVSPNVYKYNLFVEAKQIPPMAILCRVEKVDGKVVDSLNSIYRKLYKVKITAICVNMLEVEISSELENGHDAMNESLHKSIIECLENSGNRQPPNLQHMQDTVQEIQTTPPIQNTPFIARSSIATPNPFLDDCQILNRPKTPLFNGNHTPQQPIMKPTVLSPKAVPVRPSLPPVPPRSRPATPLTPIRIPVDLVRRRQKTVEDGKTVTVPTPVQERNGGEAKKIPSPEKIESKSNGAHPKIPAILPVNGFISKQPVRELLPIPMKGEEKVVTPTHVLSADQIFVQYNEWYQLFSEFQFNTLQQLQPKQLCYIPKPKDLVLARYNDEYIYRARVETIEHDKLTIFYVDYGNTEYIEFDRLFEWESVCNSIPFQATQLRLTNIHSLPVSSADDIQQFIHLNYLNKPCKALILDDSNILEVKLMNNYGRDIVEDINANLFPECIV